MEKLYINHLAVFVCALLSLVVGALWYSPVLFFKAWQKEAGMSDEQVAKANPLKTYSITLLLAWIISYNLAFFLGDSKTNWQWGLGAGLLAGVGWASTMFVIISLFEQRSFKYMLINCSYITLYFALIGFVLGIWR
jgi:fluoride ion exporter CrcB/FEX